MRRKWMRRRENLGTNDIHNLIVELKER